MSADDLPTRLKTICGAHPPEATRELPHDCICPQLRRAVYEAMRRLQEALVSRVDEKHLSRRTMEKARHKREGKR